MARSIKTTNERNPCLIKQDRCVTAGMPPLSTFKRMHFLCRQGGPLYTVVSVEPDDGAANHLPLPLEGATGKSRNASLNSMVESNDSDDHPGGDADAR